MREVDKEGPALCRPDELYGFVGVALYESGLVDGMLDGLFVAIQLQRFFGLYPRGYHIIAV